MPGLFSTRRGETNRGSRVLSTDRRTILSQWRNLQGLKYIDHQKLAPLIDVEENRNIALELKGKDAAVVINTIDKALKRTEGSEITKLHAFKVLRKLAGRTCQVPRSYLVGRWTRYTVKKEVIASGGFADIREGRLGKRVVAVRTIRMTREVDADAVHKTFCKECVLWMNIPHPNILQLIAVDIKPEINRFSMVSEMMTNGNVVDYIRAKRANRLCLLRDVANGLQHLHGLGIVHGDLKGLNILVNNETPPQACISDFGLCAIAPWMSFDPSTRKDAGGTFGYMAPELFQEGAKHTKEADVYAFGIIVYEVITGARSFGRRRPAELPMRAILGLTPARPEDPVASGFGQGTWELIAKCWYAIPQRRPTAREAWEHFERVAATSTSVDPGPVPSAQEEHGGAPEADISSGSFSKLLAQQPRSSSSRLQQIVFAAHAFINPGSARPPAPITPTVHDKPNLWGRVLRGIGPYFKLLPSSLRDT